MTEEEMMEILTAQQEAIALLNARHVQTCIDLDDLRKTMSQTLSRIGRIEYAIAQIERRFNNRT